MAAPIAQMEDDWTNFSEFSSGLSPAVMIDNNKNGTSDWNFDMKLDNNRNDVKSYQSMEDLVHRFEESVAATFKFSPTSCDDSKTTSFKPLQEYGEILACNELWKQIIDDYGLVQPLEWNTSRMRKLQLPALHLNLRPTSSDEKPKEVSEVDKHELRHQLDLHRLTDCDLYNQYPCDEADPDSQGQDGDFQTADEVIQELEDIMSDAVEQDAAFDDELEQQTGIIINENDSVIGDALDSDEESEVMQGARDLVSQSSQDESDRVMCLKQMSLAELNDELSTMEQTVKIYSENLLNQLNLRDELLYKKEVQNTFISKTLEVQYKQEQFQRGKKTPEERFKVPRLPRSFSLTNASSVAPGRYLTTVIPSGDGKVPSLEGLQALIKLLDAIKGDSDEVPSLITNYILKYLCPATTLHTLNL